VAVAQLRNEGGLTLAVDGADLRVGPEAVQVVEEPATGWQLSSDGPHSVALDVTLDQELRLEWFARDFVRTLNDLRKRRGFEIADRVRLNVDIAEDPQGNIAAMLRTHAEVIRVEVLAETLTGGVTASESAERLPIGDGSVLVDLTVPPA
jgi:isoleucyl-tRNA synthetase